MPGSGKFQGFVPKFSPYLPLSAAPPSGGGTLMRAASPRQLSTLLLPALALLALAAVAGLMWLPTADVEAYQPEGLRISLSEMPEPPCPYGHDDACENAAGSAVSVKPYQSDDPHAPALGANDGSYDHREHMESITRINQRVLARLSDSGDALDGAGNEPDGPGDDINYAITSDITGLPWVRDGQTEAEKLTVGWLSELQEHNPSLVASLVRMPFLQDHTPGDLQAIQTLTYISKNDPGDATEIVTDEDFADGGGIDNTEAKIIAVMSIPYFNGDTLLISLLTSHGTVEERNVVGRFGNPLTFAVVKWSPTVSAPQNVMQTAITSVSDAETLMGKALPVDFVGILVEDMDGALGANNGISIQVDECFGRTLRSCSDRVRQRLIAHEIGHYWWDRNDGHDVWVSEGAAEYIGAYSVKSQFGDSHLSTDYWPCPYYRTIEHLRADNPHYRFSNGSQCYYSLGERLFINLDRSMGHGAFTTGFRSLHQRLSTYKDDEIDQGLSLLRAFCPGCESNQWNLDSGGNTLARRYGEKVLTDNSAPTGTLPGLGQAVSALIRDDDRGNRQYGVAEISASSPNQRRWLMVSFSGVTDPPPETVKVFVVLYHEDREPYSISSQERTVHSYTDDGWYYFNAYLGNPHRRPIGHHWAYVYNESWQKIAEVEYQVVP